MRITLLAAATLLAVPLAAATPAGASARPPGVPTNAKGVRVARIVNGDTLDVTTSIGEKLRVMLLESDTPEPGKCWGGAATRRTAALLPVGKVAYVLKDKSPKDGYGRWLFYVWNAKGVHVNRTLVRYGFARAVLVKPNDLYITAMRAEEAKAKQERLAIWSATCDKSPQPTATLTVKPTVKPSPSEKTDPRYPTCAEANAHGYGPYRRGVDPEYAWYQDRDGDGLVCER